MITQIVVGKDSYTVAAIVNTSTREVLLYHEVFIKDIDKLESYLRNFSKMCVELFDIDDIAGGETQLYRILKMARNREHLENILMRK